MFQRAYYPESGVLATPKTRRFALQGLNSPAVSPSIFVFGRKSSMLSDKLLVLQRKVGIFSLYLVVRSRANPPDMGVQGATLRCNTSGLLDKYCTKLKAMQPFVALKSRLKSHLMSH